MANSKILASVMGKQITEADVDEFIANLGQRGQNYNTPEGRKIVLDELINQKLLLLDAQRNLYEGDPLFQAQLAKMKENLLISFAVEKTVASVKATEADAKAFYDANPEQFAQGETVNASHILVDSEEKANDILAKINAGEITFEDAAQQFSSCPSSAKGGNLGDFGAGQMVPEFDEACFEMEIGEMRGPVKTQFGYHIIKLNAKNPASTIPYEQIKAQLIEHVSQDKQKAAYQSKLNQLKILYQVDRF